MRGYFITGTDTDVGKTRVTAAVASALRARGLRVCVVKPVQTGVLADGEGDAARAARLARVPAYEFVRFRAAADPWSAALSAGVEPPSAGELAARIARCCSVPVVEGAGGIAVPLNASESLGDLAASAMLATILVVGLRLGCLSHALLSFDYLRGHSVELAGVVLVDRWPSIPAGGGDYVRDVERTLAPHATILGHMPYDEDEERSVRQLASILESRL